jgi:hypothetical protein
MNLELSHYEGNNHASEVLRLQSASTQENEKEKTVEYKQNLKTSGKSTLLFTINTREFLNTVRKSSRYFPQTQCNNSGLRSGTIDIMTKQVYCLLRNI